MPSQTENRPRAMLIDLDRKLKDLESSISALTKQNVSLNKIREHIRRGFERRDASNVKNVFEQHCLTKDALNREEFAKALAAVDLDLPSSEVEDLFKTVDVDSNKTIDFEEFKSAVRSPSQVGGWVSSLQIHEILVDALRNPLLSKNHPDTSKNHLVPVSELTSRDIELVVKGFSEGLEEVLREGVAKLKKAFEKMREKAAKAKESHKDISTKFEMISMQCGNLEDFHKGIEDKIGAPHLDFKNSMAKEHCSRQGCEHEFYTQNYGIKTTPKKEWEYVLGQAQLDKKDDRRKIPQLEDLLKLETTKRAELREEEIISMVLYTGPMYHVYNTILRKHPEELYVVFTSGKEANLFSTTIFVLGSAVQKICRVMRMPKGVRLYRGLGGNVLFPESFYKNDTNGCTGYTEWGFMSTTSNKEIAIKYSGVGDDKPMPSILVIQVGAVDRGACIQEYSQYKDEVEYLWVPASFVEQDGPKHLEVTEDGVVEMYPVKVNANLRTTTTDDLLGRKKTMHLTAFKHRIHEIELELKEVAQIEDKAEKRLKHDRTRKAEHTPSSLVAKIMEQCHKVLERHGNIPPSDYTEDTLFRGLVLEMVEVKVMALSKLREYLENEASSFILFRFNAELRTAHRRYIAFLHRTVDQLAAKQGHEDTVREQSTSWCSIKGLIAGKVTETNELTENKLMVAAAEGRSDTDIRFLVQAGAKVNEGRPQDQVTPLWLAAQFGHIHCIRMLLSLKANVNQASSNGATPLYIAAQSGYHECIELLAAFGGDVNAADTAGMTPMHQAAMNGNDECITALAKLRAKLDAENNNKKTPLDLARDNEHKGCAGALEKLLSTKVANVSSMTSKKLIITSGDISDVDGFLALAEYIKTGADVMFVMNYPAYVAETQSDETYDKEHPGLGYKYTAKEVIEAVKPAPSETDKEKFIERYRTFLKRYDRADVSDGERMKGAMTDIAFYIAKELYTEIKDTKKGTLLFCIGGVNAVNPFSAKAIKNEIGVYAPVLTDAELEKMPKLEMLEGAIYDIESRKVESVAYTTYSDVLLDFNGSMAFFNEQWRETLSGQVGDRLKGVFIMGGVYSEAAPQTMPAIPGVLNRFSSATMNQLYHPENAARLFKFLARNPHVPVYTVANNSVDDITTFSDAEKKNKSFTGVEDFLKSNGINYDFLSRIARVHYESVYNPPRKAFDFYTAAAMAKFIKEKAALRATEMQLFFCEEYGLTLISPRGMSWEETLKSYVGRIDTEVKEDDNAFIKTKKEYFVKEIGIIRTVKLPFNLNVFDVQFELSKDTKKLSIKNA